MMLLFTTPHGQTLYELRATTEQKKEQYVADLEKWSAKRAA